MVQQGLKSLREFQYSLLIDMVLFFEGNIFVSGELV